jgi:hypothetical protein
MRRNAPHRLKQLFRNSGNQWRNRINCAVALMSRTVTRSLSLVAVVASLAMFLLTAATLSVSAEPSRNATRTEPATRTCPADNLRAPARASRSRWHARLDRATAIHIVKHVQRACRGLGELADRHRTSLQRNGMTPRIAAVFGRMHSDVLAPIYRTHPSLRGKDLTQHGGTQGKITRTTAVRISNTLSRLQKESAGVLNGLIDLAPERQAAQDLVAQIVDVQAELGFASAPIHKRFPDLWAAQLRAAGKRFSSRTVESDERFRTSALPPGSVRLTPDALALIRKFTATVRKSADPDPIASISWVEESRSKGPNDKEWRVSVPSLQLGTYSRRQVPPDVIETIDGEAIVFSAADPAILAGKTIDYRDGKLVLLP